MTHELGHMLVWRAEHLPDPTGIMHHVISERVTLTEDDLDWACDNGGWCDICE